MAFFGDGKGFLGGGEFAGVERLWRRLERKLVAKLARAVLCVQASHTQEAQHKKRCHRSCEKELSSCGGRKGGVSARDLWL